MSICDVTWGVQPISRNAVDNGLGLCSSTDATHICTNNDGAENGNASNKANNCQQNSKQASTDNNRGALQADTNDVCWQPRCNVCWIVHQRTVTVADSTQQVLARLTSYCNSTVQHILITLPSINLHFQNCSAYVTPNILSNLNKIGQYGLLERQIMITVIQL